jgi:hypothetical protein
VLSFDRDTLVRLDFKEAPKSLQSAEDISSYLSLAPRVSLDTDKFLRVRGSIALVHLYDPSFSVCQWPVLRMWRQSRG